MVLKQMLLRNLHWTYLPLNCFNKQTGRDSNTSLILRSAIEILSSEFLGTRAIETEM